MSDDLQVSNFSDWKLLHVYAQEAWHDEAYILGNRQGLQELHDAIERVLRFNKESQAVLTSTDCEVMVNDGEGYSLHVVLTDSDETIDGLATPYTGDYTGSDGIMPWKLLLQGVQDA